MERRTRAVVDVVLALCAEVDPAVLVVVLAVLRRVRNVGQDSVRVGKLEQVDEDHGVVVPAGVLERGVRSAR